MAPEPFARIADDALLTISFGRHVIVGQTQQRFSPAFSRAGSPHKRPAPLDGRPLFRHMRMNVHSHFQKMPDEALLQPDRADPDALSERHARILDAAERCFVRAGSIARPCRTWRPKPP